MPRHVRTLDRPFMFPAEKWDINRGTATVAAAIINRPDGEPLTGIVIHHRRSNRFFVLPDDHAVRLANRIIDVIEAREAHGPRPAEGGTGAG
jgi:hypothetical protein